MTTTNPTDAQMKLARELMTKAAPMFPITTHNGPDYADVTFAEDHSSQAMTMEPDTWNALNELFVSLPAIFDAIQATEARAQGLVEAERERCLEIAKNELIKCKKRTWGWYICWRIHEAIRSQHSQHGGERER